MTRLEKWKQAKIITASMVISGETDTIRDWGVDIKIDTDKVVFDQVIRQVIYSKTIIKEMTLNVNVAGIREAYMDTVLKLPIPKMGFAP